MMRQYISLSHTQTFIKVNIDDFPLNTYEQRVRKDDDIMVINEKWADDFVNNKINES